jgi:hypothetical protein
LGLQALASNTTASNNTAVGYQAMYNNTTGGDGVAIGYQALYSLTSSNIASGVYIGFQAGYSASSPLTNYAENTYIGFRAGYSNTTGVKNTFVGIGANGTGGVGSATTTAYNCTIIGAFTGNQGGLDIRTANNYIVLSDGDGNPRGYFNDSGNFFVGNGITIQGAASSTITGITFPADLSTNAATFSCGTKTAASTQIQFFNGNGQVGYILTNGSATTYATSSDYRLKENVAPMTGALATVAQLKPVTYDWIADKSKGQGFIAHELQAVVPDCVTGQKDAVDSEGKPVYQGIDTSFLVATLTSAIQELKAEFDSYKATHP